MQRHKRRVIIHMRLYVIISVELVRSPYSHTVQKLIFSQIFVSSVDRSLEDMMTQATVTSLQICNASTSTSSAKLKGKGGARVGVKVVVLVDGRDSVGCGKSIPLMYIDAMNRRRHSHIQTNVPVCTYLPNLEVLCELNGQPLSFLPPT